MERNTFTTSCYIEAPVDFVYEYLCELRNLDEWTLFSRMKEKVDDDTWLGTASGYQRMLYYHIRRGTGTPFQGIEWHCGFEYKDYVQVYPTFLFPSDYIEPGSTEPGVYFHWISFIHPTRCTPLIGQGIHAVHTAECRALKGVLEHKAGRSEWAPSRHQVKTSTIFVDAPLEMGIDYLSDARNMVEWAHLLRPKGNIESGGGSFVDEYGQTTEISLKAHKQPSSVVIEHNSHYRDHAFLQRSPFFLIPCAYAFGDRTARGFIMQRISFWRVDTPPRHGKLQVEDYGAEVLNIKRFLEAKAGNLETFARGTSYLAT